MQRWRDTPEPKGLWAWIWGLPLCWVGSGRVLRGWVPWFRPEG